MSAWTRPEAAAYGADQIFENLVGKKLCALGWTCEALHASDRHGSDLLCTQRDEKAIVQCVQGAGIDLSDLQHAAALKAYHSAGQALIVHDGTPSERARSLAGEMGVVLVHTDELVVSSPYDRSEYGVRLRLERELQQQQETRSRQETENRLALMSYYEAVGQYDVNVKSWQAARRRYPWVRGLGIASLAPPFLLFGTYYFYVFMAIALALAVYAVFFTKPGAEPVAPSPIENLTPASMFPERATRAFQARPTPRDRNSRGGVPVPATIARAGRLRHGPTPELKSIVKCPKCHTKMRLPRGKRLMANCPKCKNKFRADT
ncbi:restriction endonuclease [Emcibacter sp. SYSU 3D8]|uniref:restriction endonuclease n=1 Tax=Emcibacter sp. SYSU 3D8 TaxID=3133969 RepID=UPI0031FEDC7F